MGDFANHKPHTYWKIMAYQQIYMSYKSSLTPGRTGFSTVARCESMPDALVAEVERFSQYDIKSGTVYSHRIIAAGGKSYHLLTRVKDCGVDYTNRDNYIAHHLIFGEDELESVSATAADILMSFGDWMDSFWGEPRFIREIPANAFCKYNVSRLPARAWKARFGDCAYAAVLGNTARIRAEVSDAGELLKLYAESLLIAQLKHEDWDITFTTQLLPSDKAADFAWVASASLGAQGAVVDMCANTVRFLPTGRAAEYACSGVKTNAEKYNLKVSNSIAERSRNFRVVPSLETSYTPVYVGAAVGVVLIAVAVAFLMLTENPVSRRIVKKHSVSGGDNPAAVAVASDGAGAASGAAGVVSLKKMTLSEVLAAARAKIDSGDFAGAMAFWNSQKFAAQNPEFAAQLSEDIAAKIKSMTRYCENVALNESSTGPEKMRAGAYLQALEKAGAFMSKRDADRLAQKVAELGRQIKSGK